MLLSVVLQAGTVISGDEQSVVLKIDQPQESRIIKTLALPGSRAEMKIKNCVADVFDQSGRLIRSSNLTDAKIVGVTLTSSFVMREFYGHTIEIQAVQEKGDQIMKIRSLELEVSATGKAVLPHSVSPAFLPVYRSLADNFSTSYLADLPVADPKMLIIAPSSLNTQLAYFTAWKNEKGIKTDVVNLETIGTTNEQLKTYIASYYNDPSKRPDYLLLVGDVDAPYNMPAYYFSDENDVSDLPYALIEGSDYFPELITGRFSVDSSNELLTIIKKILSYEKTPYTANSGWFKKGLLVAGNYSDTNPQPTTPTEVSKWLKEKMLNNGFTGVDQVYYAPPEYMSYPGTSEILSSWNNGVSFVSYRGWGNAYGWHYPEFKVDHMDGLSNTNTLPVVTSIVCGTGNFAQSTVDPCFAEKVLRLGTPTSPKGGVGVIAPSDLHTSTKYNNALFAGFYGGLFDEKIYSFGTAFLRGKTELYRNFPQEHGTGSQVEFYYYVYNLLGDPSLAMWSDVPKTVICILPDNITVGTNYLDISSNITNGYACAVRNGQIIGRTVVKNGQAVLYFDNNSTTPIKVTLTGDNCNPLIKEITVQNAAAEALVLQGVSGEIIQGVTATLSITLKNFGTVTTGSVSGDLTSTDSYVTIISGSNNFGAFANGESATRTYTIQASADCPSGRELPFKLTLSNGKVIKFSLLVKGLTYQISSINVNDADHVLSPGEEPELILSVKNTGSSEIINAIAILTTSADAVTITQAASNIGSMAPNEVEQGVFKIKAKNDAAVGHAIPLELTVTDGNGVKNTTKFYLTIGNVSNEHPTGSDRHGYFAYDSYDAQYSEKPVYSWQEIDPQSGGSGTVISMKDDEVKTVAFPLNFKYYGVQPDSITLSSNGWISFVPTKITNFTNWQIPAGLGAYAMVAPYWDDLIGKKLAQGYENMRICYLYDAAQHRYIVEWNECYSNYDDTSLEKFQIIFYDPAYYPTRTGDGEIIFNYHTINNVDANNNYATVGIENHAQSDGLLYSYSNSYSAGATPLTAGLSIKFTTDAPDPYVGVDNYGSRITTYELKQNYPNPFNNSTLVSYQLPESGPVEITVLNQNGQTVKTLVKSSLNAGVHQITFDAAGLNSGVYFVKMSAGSFKQVNKCLLVK